MRTYMEWMWLQPPQAPASHELPVAWSWLPRLSKQSYWQSNKDLFKWSLSQSHNFQHSSPQPGFFPHQLLQGRDSWKQETFQKDKKGWNLCFASHRRDVQRASLDCQQLDTQKWRPWKLLTLYRSLWETSKGLCKDERGWEGIAPSTSHSSCSSQNLRYVSLEKRNARTETKTRRKKHPTVLISMDAIKAKAFSARL